MTWKIEKRKSVLKPAAVAVLASAGLGLSAQAASANPPVQSAVLADGAGNQEAIKVIWQGGGRGQQSHQLHFGYGFGRGYPAWPATKKAGRWGYRGHHYLY
jgi:hypothetical protein